MIKPPYTKWINDIKTKLGFSRTMTATGADVVDAVNKQAEQIGGVTLPTTAQTLTGAIAENHDEIEELSTIRTGTVTINGHDYIIRRQGRLVVFDIYIPSSAGIVTTTSWVTVGNIPVGFRPASGLYLTDTINPQSMKWYLSDTIQVQSSVPSSQSNGGFAIAYYTNNN